MRKFYAIGYAALLIRPDGRVECYTGASVAVAPNDESVSLHARAQLLELFPTSKGFAAHSYTIAEHSTAALNYAKEVPHDQ